MRAALPWLLSAAILAGAAPARAAETATENLSSDELKRRGDEAMVALRYADALDYYRRVYDTTKSPALLYNMGRAYEGLGEFPKALDALEEFADKAPKELKAKVPKLDELLADVRNRVSTVIVSSNVPDAEIRIGDRLVGKTKPGQAVFRVNTGKQHVRVTHDAYRPFDRDVDLSAANVQTIDVTLRSKKVPVIRITSPVGGAAVSIDGAAVGVVPAEAEVKPGSHKISLQRSGYDPAQTSVVVAEGEDKNVDVPMAARDTITGKWWFWTGVGVAVVAGGIATYIVATTERTPDSGTIPPGQVKAALVRF